MPDAVDVHAQPNVLAGRVPVASRARAQHQGDRVGGLLAHRDDPGAQSASGRNGRQQVEEVRGDQGGGQHGGNPATAPPPPSRLGGPTTVVTSTSTSRMV